jgi:hypothetical protein
MPSDHPRYLRPKDVRALANPKTGTLTVTLRALTREEIDGRPQLVLYVEEDPRGIILTRVLYEDLSKHLGRSVLVEEFFQSEGNLH